MSREVLAATPVFKTPATMPFRIILTVDFRPYKYVREFKVCKEFFSELWAESSHGKGQYFNAFNSSGEYKPDEAFRKAYQLWQIKSNELHQYVANFECDLLTDDEIRVTIPRHKDLGG